MTEPKPHHDAPPPRTSVADGLTGAARRAADGVEANPLALVAGGLVLGVVLGALLPRTERERQLLAPVGERIGTGVAAALDAAKEAGRAELEGAGINGGAARDQVKGLIDSLVKAATSAGTAAVGAAGKTTH